MAVGSSLLVGCADKAEAPPVRLVVSQTQYQLDGQPYRQAGQLVAALKAIKQPATVMIIPLADVDHARLAATYALVEQTHIDAQIVLGTPGDKAGSGQP